MNNSYNERSMKIIDLKKTVLEDNDVDADRLREELKKKNVFYMNVMSSPGSGKTTTIVGTIERLRKHFNIGVMEADIDSDVDALTVAKAGVSAVQLHTGGMCHLDADVPRHRSVHFLLHTASLKFLLPASALKHNQPLPCLRKASLHAHRLYTAACQPA